MSRGASFFRGNEEKASICKGFGILRGYQDCETATIRGRAEARRTLFVRIPIARVVIRNIFYASLLNVRLFDYARYAVYAMHLRMTFRAERYQIFLKI